MFVLNEARKKAPLHQNTNHDERRQPIMSEGGVVGDGPDSGGC